MSRAGIFASAVQAADALVSTFQGVYKNASNVYSFSFSDVPVGAASASRRVVVALAYRGGAPVISVTIGGVSAAMDAALTSGSNQAEIWSAVLPTGTTATIDVVLTTGGSQSSTGLGMGVWTLSGGTAASSAVMTPPNQRIVNLSLTTQVGDVCIALVSARCGLAPPDMTWNEATSRYDEAWDGTPRTHAGADLVATGSTADMGGDLVHFSIDSAAVAVAYR